MTKLNVEILGVLLVVLIFISGFFSGSETGMMSLNRYRLRHLSRKGRPAAKRVMKLLERPDRLLGVILIGNTFANIMASSIATLIAVHYFGDAGIVVATIVLTLVVLIFAETAPKTVAALYPDRVAYKVSWILNWLLKIMYPLVWVVNAAANAILRLFQVKIRKRTAEPLTAEELRSLVHEAKGKISSTYQEMLLRILELERVTVEDVMVPRNAINGLDLTDSWELNFKKIINCEHSHMPLFREHIDDVAGMLNMRKVLSRMQRDRLREQDLLRLADKVYFVPEGALLNRQILNFQEQQKNISLVVDEYGDIQGLVTLQDVLEEIVGEFAGEVEEFSRLIKSQKDGTVLVDGRISIRDLNRQKQWDLPIEGPKTLSGLIIEYLEMIPHPGICCRIAGYPMEIVRVSGNTIKLVQIFPSFVSNQLNSQ